MSVAHLRDYFSIDRASLAAFRFGLCALVIADLCLRWPLAALLLSPTGVLATHPEEAWGLLSFSDFEGAHVLLFVLTGSAALVLATGRFSRVSSALLLLGVSSIQARNPWILDGGDGCLRLLILWNLLMSLEQPEAPSLSGDAFATPSQENGRVFSFAGVGLLLQPVVLYLSSVAHKLKGDAWREGVAVEIALRQSLWERSLGAWIVETEHLPEYLTYLTLAIELLGPLLLLSPYRPRLCRSLGVGLLTALQIGIASSLRMNLFPWIMTLALVPYVSLPAGLRWANVEQLGGRECRASKAGARFFVHLSQAFLLQSLLAVTDSILGGRVIPHPVAYAQRALGIEQSWAMYSPNPYAFDFGLEVKAQTERGESLLLDPGRSSHPFAPLGRLWADYRGGIYFENVASPDWPEELSELGEWLAREYENRGGSRLVEISFALVEWPKAEPESASKTSLLVWKSPVPKGEHLPAP